MKFSLVAFTVTTLIHQYRDVSAKEYGDMVVKAVHHYQKENGKLPQSLDDIPALASAGPRPHHVEYYRNKDGALLYYSSSFSYLKRMIYDFNKQTWKSVSG